MVRLELFDGSHVDAIIGDAMAVLERIGFAIESTDGEELLEAARVPRRGSRFCPGTGAIEGALASAPRRFALCDRSGEPVVRFGEGLVQFDPGSAAVYRLDGATGERRTARASDLVALARLVEGLPGYAAQSTALVAGDVPTELSDSFRLWVALAFGRKPVVTGTFTKSSFGLMREMLLAVRGGDGELREKPLALFDCCPTSPLHWTDLTAQALIDCARSGIPAEIVPVPLTGATAPVTLRETIVQHVAEGLSGLLIHQLASPGSPVVLGGAPAAFDMRLGAAVMAAPESLLLQAGFAQVARKLGLPCHGYLGLSDGKCPDYQAGMESTAGAVMGALAGFDLIAGPGLLDFLLTQSFEKLVLDHEACALALRLARGIEAREGDAVELVGAAVSTGQMLGHPHTRRHYRAELRVPSPLIDRAAWGDWSAAGSLSAVDRARSEVARRLEGPATGELEGSRREELDRLLAGAAQRIGAVLESPSGASHK